MGNDLVRILVTGAASYLGQHVLANLKGKRLACVATSRSGRVGAACDLADRGAVRDLLDRVKPSVIIHCAAVVPKSASDYNDAQAAELSVAMVELIAENAICPVVFASSMTVYAGATNFPVHEDDAQPPVVWYAHGKWRAEEVLFARNCSGDVALRLPGLFGLPRRSGLLYNAAKSFLTRGQFEPMVSPGIWAALGVQDAAEYLVKAAVAPHDRPPQAVNIGYEGEFSVSAAVAEVAACCGLNRELPPARVQPFSMYLERLKARYGMLAVTFRQRIRELVEIVQHDLQAARVRG
ncbi:MAG: NAD-dependent epimerase/dehydratase family protein [Nitrospiraceae bacterium]